MLQSLVAPVMVLAASGLVMVLAASGLYGLVRKCVKLSPFS